MPSTIYFCLDRYDNELLLLGFHDKQYESKAVVSSRFTGRRLLQHSQQRRRLLSRFLADQIYHWDYVSSIRNVLQ